MTSDATTGMATVLSAEPTGIVEPAGISGNTGTAEPAATADPACGLERGRGSADRPHEHRPSLSPSRASDFKTCPLLYRFRCIDRLPEQPSPDAVRGTVVHAVLERLYDLPAAQRTPEHAVALVDPQWSRLLEIEPALRGLFPDTETLSSWLASARELVEGYFTLEDPTALEPAERECLVETELDDGLLLRGYVDRLDVAPSGDIRVVDYKTGGAPRAAFEAKALFQMKFYALVLWRSRGVLPRVLRLIYLKDRDTLTYSPDEEELRRFELTVQAIWAAIGRARQTGDFRPSPGPLCGWCDHQALCPAWGGTPPPYPRESVPEAPEATSG
ncbi:MAG: RecB family exonuclease [Mycobacteriales bacterium]